MKCEYVCGTSRKSAKGEKGTAKGEMKAVLQMKKCGKETNTLIANVPICTEHAMFSKPLLEWI